MELLRKTVSGIILTLLFMGTLTSAFNIQPVKSTWTGTVYIRADGSIDPSDAPIITYDNITYTLTDNITSSADGIVVERDNIVIEGAGYTLEGTGEYPYKGVDLNGRSNVTIKNTTITKFYYGIGLLFSSNNNSIVGNNITNNGGGIGLIDSSNNIISGNTFTDDGLYVRDSYRNVVENNTVNGKPLVYLEGVANYSVGDAGQVILVNCTGIRVENLNLSKTDIGIQLWETSNTIIRKNNIANNEYGIRLDYSSNNGISSNNITANKLSGIYLGSSGNNNISANAFIRDGLTVESSYRNVVENNLVNGKPLVYFEEVSDLVVGDAGQVVLVRCSNITVENLNLSNTDVGVQLWLTNNIKIVNNNITANDGEGIYLCSSSNNSIVGNNITNNTIGIDIRHSSLNNTICDNNIANNRGGIWLWNSYNNKFYYNNFINNTQHVFIQTPSYTNVWDNSYPSGGNYWSNYTGIDANRDAIGDTPHIIDANNIDNYPLRAPINIFYAGTWNEKAYYIDVVSNSTVSDFHFNPDEGAFLRFNVTGDDGTMGFCRVTIPNDLLWVDDGWTITVGNQSITNYILISNENYTYLYFTYNHSTHTVTIQGIGVISEFPSSIALLGFLMLVTIPLIFTKKCYRKAKT